MCSCIIWPSPAHAPFASSPKSCLLLPLRNWQPTQRSNLKHSGNGPAKYSQEAEAAQNEPKLQRSGGGCTFGKEWSVKYMVLTKHTKGQMATRQVDRMVHRGTICLSSYPKVSPRLP